MRTIRIYQAGTYQAGSIIELSSEAGHHVAVVLRMKEGDVLSLFRGDNRVFDAIITQIKKKQVFVTVKAEYESNKESPFKIHLAQAISKGDKMDLVMQKSVELGVTQITPIFTEHCSVSFNQDKLDKKMNHWQAIIISACEQCGRNYLPILNPPKNIEEYVKNANENLKLIVHPYTNKTWRDYVLNITSVSLIIGPEGGISDQEFTYAIDHSFEPISLGPRILRTETAALTALSILQALGGDL